MTVKRKKILAISLGLTAISVPIIGTGIYLGLEESKAFKLNHYKDFINNFVNSDNISDQINNDFIKGADVSSYADMIENFLFEKNIKKYDDKWYTYEDIASDNFFTWDPSLNKEVTLSEYINNNFYSYYDNNSERIYANMFEILANKGINSLRLKLWVDPYDINGNPYGGGHNDIETTIFIINEAKKYGFNDFLLNIHYSDFWADPGKQYLPKSWASLNEQELYNVGSQYTFDVLERIYNETGIHIKRIQYGNEINNSMLWTTNQYKPNNYAKTNKFILACIEKTKKYEIKYNCRIDKSIHFAAENLDSLFLNIDKYKDVIKEIDTIQLSSYLVYSYTLNQLFDCIMHVTNKYPAKKIVVGEVSIPFTSYDYGFLNDGSAGLANKNKPNYFDYSPEIQALITYQYMQLISRLLPNIETGFYWWEIGYQYVGRSTWATMEGMKYLTSIDNSKHNDISNWSSNTCFDKNHIALPVLDTISNFTRNPDFNEYQKYEPSTIVNMIDNQNSEKNIFYKLINFNYPKQATKLQLSKICYNTDNINASDLDIDLNIYLNQYDYEKYLLNYNLNEILKFIVTSEFKKDFDSIMFDQIEINNFVYDEWEKIGSFTINAKANSFYYKGSNTFKFKVHDSYYQNTIDLTNTVIEIDKTNNEWYKDIINALKLQENWAFGKQIWDTFGIEGGASEDNTIWLWDPNKYTNRNAEFFLLDNDQIRLHNNKVDFDVLKEHKIWIDNFSKYNSGEHEIYFAIKKGLNDIVWEYDIPSTYSQVGKESWKYVDLLVYKLKINIS